MLLISSLKTAGITAKSQSTVSWDSQSILKTLAWQILSKSHDVIQIHPFLSLFFFFFPLTSFSSLASLWSQG